MSNNKSPGPDGKIVEFYKEFWGLLGAGLSMVLVNCLNNEQLTYSKYMAIIILLYKKGTREDLSNWIPISLINSDIKIISKVLATRLKKATPNIIHTDQKGFIENRYIGHNIRLVQDVLNEQD